MNYRDILETLKNASAFDLYRLSCAIDREMDRPEHIVSVQRQIRPGQIIRYFDGSTNREFEARVTKFGRTRLHVEHIEDGRRWRIPYYMVNLGGVDVSVSQHDKNKVITANDLSIGQPIGFYDRENQERSGVVERINQKSVSVRTETGRWRVAYCYLFPLIEGDTFEVAELISAEDNELP
ncbi:hypothetical protein ACH42_10995 [Endozoicomonas sp. (ex Bugula neritina AB1)]|nr:hypothetical protein ACH42_10995 [Endozoicomonas sp. (ex Bugula neritina AB1)]